MYKIKVLYDDPPSWSQLRQVPTVWSSWKQEHYFYVLKYCHKWVQNNEGVIDDFSWKSSIVWLATVAIAWVTMYVRASQSTTNIYTSPSATNFTIFTYACWKVFGILQWLFSWKVVYLMTIAAFRFLFVLRFDLHVIYSLNA